MNVEFYYKDSLLGIWHTLNPLEFSLLEEYGGIPKSTNCNKEYYVEDAEDFFNKACYDYYDLSKNSCDSSVIKEILYFTKCSNPEDAKKQFQEIESFIHRKILIENFNNRIEQLYKMFKYYKNKNVNNSNSFYFKYTED